LERCYVYKWNRQCRYRNKYSNNIFSKYIALNIKAPAGYGSGTIFKINNVAETNFYAESGITTLNIAGVYAITGSFGTAFRVTSGGNVLIGTTTDSGYKLDVNGTGRFSGALSGTSATFSGTLTLNAYGNQLKIGSNGGTDGFIGIGSGQSTMFLGDYALATKGLTINLTTGAATFSSSVTATGFFESSSIKGKDIIATNPLLALDIDVIKYTRKSDESKDIRYGYSAEQIHSLMPELTDKDVTAVKYLDVHTILISQLQQEIKELKAKMN